MIFYVQCRAHDGQFWTDRASCRFSRGWKRKAAGLRAVHWGACEPPPIRGHAKDIATQMAGILAPARSEDYEIYHLATDNKGAHFAAVIQLFLEPRGGLAMFQKFNFCIINLPLTDVKSELWSFISSSRIYGLMVYYT